MDEYADRRNQFHQGRTGTRGRAAALSEGKTAREAIAEREEKVLHEKKEMCRRGYLTNLSMLPSHLTQISNIKKTEVLK